MNNLKFSIQLAVILFVLSACTNSERVSVYRCNSPVIAEGCNSHCKIDEDLKFSFLIDLEKKSVLRKVYFKGNLSGSTLSHKCTIFNKSNWDCSESVNVGVIDGQMRVMKTIEKMNDGVYAYYTEYWQGYQSSRPEEGVCAK